MDQLYLLAAGGGVVLMIALVGWVLANRRGNRQATSAQPDPGAAATLKPMLSEAQARFYNLLRLAVEDRYLIFAHVPLWCVVNVPMPETGSRVPLLSQLALKRAAFVLVHPGTRQAEKVVDWTGENGNDSSEKGPDPLLEALSKSTGVQLVTINARDSHTVADLIALFGLGEVE